MNYPNPAAVLYDMVSKAKARFVCNSCNYMEFVSSLEDAKQAAQRHYINVQCPINYEIAGLRNE